MTNLLRVIGLLTALFISASVYAGDIQVENAWARATAPGQDAASVDLTITSKQAATLVGVSSRVARTAQLHSMAMEGGMMRMREVAGIALPAGKTVNLGERGYHLMLTGLKAPLKEGETVSLMLSIRVGNRGVVQVKAKAEVRSLTATSPPTQKMDHQPMN
ncbi:MAG: copper chaperone PCu(A)C [Gallionella sp.]